MFSRGAGWGVGFVLTVAAVVYGIAAPNTVTLVVGVICLLIVLAIGVVRLRRPRRDP